jgi:hypothetical protein
MDKKEIKKQYKQSLRPMGIFQIKNLANNKIFIGSSSNIEGKLNSIKFQLEMGSYINKDLQKDFNQFGVENFLFETLDILEPKQDTEYNYNEDLKTLEEMWIDKLQPFNERGYHKQKDTR